jgi:hypothetical protein
MQREREIAELTAESDRLHKQQLEDQRQYAALKQTYIDLN